MITGKPGDGNAMSREQARIDHGRFSCGIVSETAEFRLRGQNSEVWAEVHFHQLNLLVLDVALMVMA
jgi:hypothetical protein